MYFCFFSVKTATATWTEFKTRCGRQYISMPTMYCTFLQSPGLVPPRHTRSLPKRYRSVAISPLGRKSGPLGSRRGRSTQERVRSKRTHYFGKPARKFRVLKLERPTHKRLDRDSTEGAHRAHLRPSGTRFPPQLRGLTHRQTYGNR